RRNATAEQLDQEAASRVRFTVPTYSQAPAIVQKVARRGVFIGDYVTWPAEVIRTSINNVRLATRDLRDPEMRSEGFRRLLQLATIPAGLASIGPVSRMMVGVSKEQEEALRVLAPDWMKNSTWAWISRPERLKVITVDTQYSVPQSMLTNAPIALLRGKDTKEAFIEAGIELLRPFANRTILAEVIGDLWANQHLSKGSTQPIYNEEAPGVDQIVDIEEFLRDRLQPGTIRSLERIWKGIFKKPLKSGRVPDTGDEAIAVALGVRLATHDIPRQFGFYMGTLLDRRDHARKIFFTSAFARDGRDDEEIQEAFDKAVRAEREIFDQIQEAVGAAKAWTMTDKEIMDAMSDKRVAVPKTLAKQILENDFDEEKLIRDMVVSLAKPKFDERIPRILRALGVSESEADRLLIEDMNLRAAPATPGTPLKLPTLMRFGRMRDRLKAGGG
ncbi:MAG: hypothetical protein ACYTFZ_07925, partial [Planctomycetota bacterium]